MLDNYRLLANVDELKKFYIPRNMAKALNENNIEYIR